MTSVFSSIPWSSKATPRPCDSAMFHELPSGVPPPDVSDERSEIDELNECLHTLTELFPDIQPEVFREMLSSFDGTSRLHVITEALLKHPGKWVQGRYRTPQEQELEHKYKYKSVSKKDLRGVPLVTEDKFRNEAYKSAVKATLYQEFKGLNHSTIRAVLAEYNYSYTHARPTLVALVSKSWRYSITSFFTRRKPPSANDHPLVRWHREDSATAPLLRFTSTKNWELDRELSDTLVAPVLADWKEKQEQRDFELAEELNEAEAEEAGEMYDCECCCIPRTVEQLSTCDDEAHYLCHFCIRNAVNEALYGQGWARSVSTQRSTIRCLAAGTDNCDGCVPAASLRLALKMGRDGAEAYRKFNERCATETLQKTKLPLIKCPFCVYAEVDTIALASPPLPIKLKNQSIFALTTLSFLKVLSFTVVQGFLLFLFALLTVNYLFPDPISGISPISASLTRLARKRRGLKFNCLSPHCRRSSCMSCYAEWHDIHICHESSLTSLRTYIERAMADAVKRTCPACNLSFVKSSGCNKLTCVCGYTMCYVCRKEIGAEGYAHFCQHFRQDPGKRCNECDRCDLYKTEDEEKTVRHAKDSAEKEWLEREGKTGSGFELEVDEQSGIHGFLSREGARKLLRKELWEKWLDKLLDAVLV